MSPLLTETPNTAAPPSQPQPSGPTPKELAAARAAVAELRAALVARAPRGDARFFARSMPSLGAGDAALIGKYADAVALRRPFSVALAGTSNAACHDTAVDTCFPAYFVADLEAVLAPVRVPVQLRASGIGGTNGVFWAWCLEALLGTHIRTDVVLFELSMADMGMDCLHPVHEMLIRAAVAMPGTPVPHFVDIEGGRQDLDGADKHTEEMDEHHPPLYDNAYKDFGAHRMKMRDALWTVDTESPFRYEELFVTFHPGPTGHRFVADHLLAYHLEALDAALMQLLASTWTPAPSAPPKLPPPVTCGDWCVPAARPQCFTSFQPRFGVGTSLADASPTLEASPAVVPVQDAPQLLLSADTKVGSQWTRVIAPSEILHPARNYTDFKIVWAASHGAPPARFKVTVPAKSALGVVLVCMYPAPWERTPDGWGTLIQAAQITIDGTIAKPIMSGDVGVPRPDDPSRSSRQWHSPNACGRFFEQTCVMYGSGLAPGPHTVTVSPFHKSLTISISAVVAL